MTANVISSKTKHLTFSYFLALFLIFLMVLVMYALVHLTVNKQDTYAHVINVAGRQRMLSQQINKELLLLSHGESMEMIKMYSQSLEKILDTWSSVHYGLQRGDKELGLPGKNSEEVKRLFSKLEPSYQGIKTAVEKKLAMKPAHLSPTHSLHAVDMDIAGTTAVYLKFMDKIVAQYEKEAGYRIERLKKQETVLLFMLFALLLLEGRFIFRPMIKRVKDTYMAFQQANENLQQEIIERKKTEEALIRYHNELEIRVDQRTAELRKEYIHTEYMLSSISSILIGVDRGDKVTRWNKAAEETFGIAAKDALDRRFMESGIDWDWANILENIYKCREEVKEIRHEEYAYVRQDGKKGFLNLTISPITDDSGEWVGFIVLGRDITERKVAEQALKDSEGKVRLLLDSTGEAIYAIDLDGNCTLVNLSCLMILGYSDTSELMGKNVHDMIHHTRPDGTRHIEEDCPIVRSSRYTEEIHVDSDIFWRKDGTSFLVEYWSHPVIHDNEIIGTVVTFLDITKRKQEEEALKEREERLRSITSSINDAIVMVDGEGKVTFWNKTAEKIFQYSSDEIIGEHLHDRIIPPEYRDAHINGLEEFRMTGQGAAIGNTVELEGLRKNGEKFPLELSLSAIKIKEAWHAIGTIRDLTERKQAEEELRSSKEQLSRIVETVAEGLYIVSPEGRIIFANRAAEKIFGMPREELYKRTFNDPRWAVHNIDGTLVSEDEHPFEIVKKTKKPVYGVEIVTQRQDGKESIVSINAAPFFDSSGAFQGMVATEQDITERKNAEKEIRDAHWENEQLLAALPSALISLDRNYRVSKWNAAAENIFGIPVEKATGARFDECDIKWDWGKIQEVINTCEKTGESIVLDEIKYVRADTKDGFFSLTVNPVQDGSHAVTGFLILGTDTTEKMILESQLTQAQKLESIGSLAAGIAHEINTPTQFVGDNIHFLEGAFQDIQTMLNKYDQLLEASKKEKVSDELIKEIDGVAEEADMEFLSGEIPKAIRSSLKGVGRVTTIVKAMKDFSHPGSKEKSLVDINRMIESTVTISRNEWKYVSEMVTNFDPSLGLVPCYPDEFNQVILNLITNASHAIGKVVTEGVQDKGTITIETRKENDKALISISDTGTGIPNSIKDKIFDHFFTTKEVGRGTGQGLSISRTIIVEKHKGSLSFDTQEGKGTTFFIRLPLDKSN